MKRLAKVALALGVFLSVSGAVHAEEARSLPWRLFTTDVADPSNTGIKLIKTFTVGTSMAAYHIAVKNCANDISAVKLRLSNAGVRVQSFGVTFTDNTSRQFNVNRTYPAGTESPWIDLGIFRAMDSRCVADVVATAQSTGGTATVEVFANTK